MDKDEKKIIAKLGFVALILGVFSIFIIGWKITGTMIAVVCIVAAAIIASQIITEIADKEPLRLPSIAYMTAVLGIGAIILFLLKGTIGLIVCFGGFLAYTVVITIRRLFG